MLTLEEFCRMLIPTVFLGFQRYLYFFIFAPNCRLPSRREEINYI